MSSSSPRHAAHPLSPRVVMPRESTPRVPSASGVTPLGVTSDRGGLLEEREAGVVPREPPLLTTVAPDARRKRRMCRRGSGELPAATTPTGMTKAVTAAKTAKTTKTAPLVATQFVVATPEDERSIRARVQRLLVQFVMLPVVWVSLCCVITAAMGIEAVESIQKALVQGDESDRGVMDDDANGRPAKKARRENGDCGRGLFHSRRRDVEVELDDVCGNDDAALVRKTPKKRRRHQEEESPMPLRSVSHVLAAAAPPPTPRRRRVLIWDLDETLVLFASLYSGQFARTHDKDLATSVALGEQMMTYLVAVLERHFFFSDLHDTDVDHITSVPPQDKDNETPAGDLSGIPKGSPQYARVVADRYARIRAIYERRAEGVDFLDDPSSQWFSARQALVSTIDAFSTGWIREASELLTLTTGRAACGRDDEEIINVMVTNTQLSPALCKCLIYGLDAHFPIDSIYSSSKLHKLRCFQTIMAKYSTEASDVEFVAIGDGAEEEQVSRALGLSFLKIRSLDDLQQLRFELQLAERPPARGGASEGDDDGVAATTRNE